MSKHLPPARGIGGSCVLPAHVIIPSPADAAKLIDVEKVLPTTMLTTQNKWVFSLWTGVYCGKVGLWNRSPWSIPWGLSPGVSTWCLRWAVHKNKFLSFLDLGVASKKMLSPKTLDKNVSPSEVSDLHTALCSFSYLYVSSYKTPSFTRTM